MIVNQAELAKIVGKTTMTIHNWQKQGLPIASAGARGNSNTYDTVEVFKWLEQRNKAEAPETDLEQERTRKIRIEADLAALTLAKEQGDLVPADQVEREWVERVTRMKAKMRSIPTRSASQLVLMSEVPEVEHLLLGMVDEALQELGS